MKNFDPQTALSYAREISRPRMVGTPGEESIRQEISRRLEGMGLNVRHQPFRFSTTLEVFIALEILVSQLLVLASIWISRSAPGAAVFLVIPLVAIVVGAGRLNRSVSRHSFSPSPDKRFAFWSNICWTIGAHYATENIVGTYPGAARKPNLPRLYLVAHYDSKSQRIPLTIRIALFTISIIGSLLFSGLIVVAIFVPALTLLYYMVAGVVLLSSIPLLFLDYGNDSPGAIDDASGVGVVLHLAEILADYPEIHDHLDVTVLLTGAEELGTAGAFAYVQENQSEIRDQSATSGLHVLNFDGVGVAGSLYLVAPGKVNGSSTGIALRKLITEACHELGYQIGIFRLPGALFDHMPFADLGCDTASLIAIGKHTWFIHSSNDSDDKLDLRGIERAGRVGLKIVEKLFANYQVEPRKDATWPDKRDLYKHDPVLRFLVDKLRFTPNQMFFVGLICASLDLLIAWHENLLRSGSDVGIKIIPALEDPPYLLTMFIMIPLFLRTYVWMADGIWEVLMGLERNRLIREQDRETYQTNISRLAGSYTQGWVAVTMACAVGLQLLIEWGNLTYGYQTYNTTLTYSTSLMLRQILFRIPLGLFAIYAAASVLVRVVLLDDWHDLMKGIELQLNPTHWDETCGYSPFTNYVVNLLGVFVGIAIFFFTKLLFQYDSEKVVWQANFNLGVLVSLVLALVMGYVMFYYFPTRVASKAMLRAKRRQLEAISDRYLKELQVFLLLLGNEGGKFQAPAEFESDKSHTSKPERELLTIKGQLERLGQLNDATRLLEGLPESPINRKALKHFAVSFVSIPVSTGLVNSFQFLISGQDSFEKFGSLFAKGPIDAILGVLRILSTGKPE